MKRAIGLGLIILACIAGFISVRGNMPFMPVFGSSMEPDISSGSLLIIEPVEAGKVNDGDIIVYSVPRLYREYYNYPPIIAHRVIEVLKDQPGTWLRVKGDSAIEDPFLVRLQDVRGTAGSQIPYLGLPLVFFRSGPGTLFIAFAIVMLGLFFYSKELVQITRRMLRLAITPVVQENNRSTLVLSQRFEATEIALDKFANAIQIYAQHMASHTSAIQGLKEASQSLKGSAAEQNDILAQLTKTIKRERTTHEVMRVERVVNELEKRTLQVLQVKDELEHKSPTQESTGQGKSVLKEEVQSPPGCTVNAKALLARRHHFCAV